MDTFGAKDPRSAAAQGEQADDPHHANGAIFTGLDQSVQAPQDAVHQPVFFNSHDPHVGDAS